MPAIVPARCALEHRGPKKSLIAVQSPSEGRGQRCKHLIPEQGLRIPGGGGRGGRRRAADPCGLLKETGSRTVMDGYST